MSLLDRIAVCHRWDPDAYRPFVVGGEAVGRIQQDFARRLAHFAPTFGVCDRTVELDPRLTGFEERSAAVAEVLLDLRDQGHIHGWRDEAYPVVQQWGQSPLLLIERAAVPLFGVRGFGVHLNGIVGHGAGAAMWVSRRSMTKPTGPGKLDHLAAGGQPHGIGVRENMIKECQEEADIPPLLTEGLVPVGMLTYRCERAEGLRDDALFCFDLELPEDFEPRNTDGEVDAFYLWPMEKVIEVLRETEDFKFNCALVIIDFLVRHGFLDPDEPGYAEIQQGLRIKN